VELRPREEEADGAEETRDRRHEDGPHAEILREAGRVNRPGAAVGDQREVARVAPLLGRDRPQRPRHPRVRDPVDPTRRLEEGQTERLGDAAHRLLGQLRGDRDLPVGDRAGGHVAEDDVCVGDRWLDAAAPVAGRARVGARAARPDLEAASRIDPGDAAASRADLGDVDRRDSQQLTGAADQAASGGHRAADLVLAATRDRAVLDQRRLGRRAAHVEGEQIADSELLPHPAGCHDARRRPRLEREDRPLLRVGGGHHAAGRLHDLERPFDPDPSRPVRIRSMYEDISGRTYALTTVVAERSYSRCSRRISLESETFASGSSSARIAAKRCSCSG
jgi:hypothetical protein